MWVVVLVVTIVGVVGVISFVVSVCRVLVAIKVPPNMIDREIAPATNTTTIRTNTNGLTPPLTIMEEPRRSKQT
ncbi:MAG: hypothetical protein QXV81_09040 [Ignisphaera sp.]